MNNNDYSQLVEVSSEYLTFEDSTLQSPPPHSSPYQTYGSYQSQPPGPISSGKTHQLVPMGQNLESNGAHHHSKAHRPIVLITLLQLLGLVLSLAILVVAVYGAIVAYRVYLKMHTCSDKSIECKLRKDFSIYYILQLIGAVIQALNSAHGTFSFLFRSAKCLEIYGKTSTTTLVWQAIQTIALIAFSQITVGGKQNPVPADTIIGLVVGWIPILITIIASQLRYRLLTWNMLTLFTCLDNWMFEETKPAHPHCIPHEIITLSQGCCQSMYVCSHCGEEWRKI